jgi:hypothetical protein
MLSLRCDPEVGFGEISIDLLQARFQGALTAMSVAISSAACRALSHVNLGAASPKMDFIHKRHHQVNAAAMTLDLIDRRWIRNLGQIKTFSFVPNNN